MAGENAVAPGSSVAVDNLTYADKESAVAPPTHGMQDNGWLSVLPCRRRDAPNMVSLRADVLVEYAMHAASLLQHLLTTREQAIRAELQAAQAAAAGQEQRGHELLTRAAQKVEFKALMMEAVEEVSMRHEQATAQLVKTLSEMSSAGNNHGVGNDSSSSSSASSSSSDNNNSCDGGGQDKAEWSTEKLVDGVQAVMREELRLVQAEVHKLHDSVATTQHALEQQCVAPLTDVREGLWAVQRQMQATRRSDDEHRRRGEEEEEAKATVDGAALQQVVEETVSCVLRRAAESGAMDKLAMTAAQRAHVHAANASVTAYGQESEDRSCAVHTGEPASSRLDEHHADDVNGVNSSEAAAAAAGNYVRAAEVAVRAMQKDGGDAALLGGRARAALPSAANAMRAARIRRDGRICVALQPAWKRRAKQHVSMVESAAASSSGKKECYFAWHAPVRS